MPYLMRNMTFRTCLKLAPALTGAGPAPALHFVRLPVLQVVEIDGDPGASRARRAVDPAPYRKWYPRLVHQIGLFGNNHFVEWLKAEPAREMRADNLVRLACVYIVNESWGSSRFRQQLCLATTLHRDEPPGGLFNRMANGQQAMVLQYAGFGSGVGTLWGLFCKAGEQIRRHFVLTYHERAAVGFAIGPSRVVAGGVPYEGIENLRPESKAAVQEFLFMMKTPEM